MIVLGKKYRFTIQPGGYDRFIELVRTIETMDGAKLPSGQVTSDLGEYFDAWTDHIISLQDDRAAAEAWAWVHWEEVGCDASA